MKMWPQQVSFFREHARQVVRSYEDRNWQGLFANGAFATLRAVSDGRK